MQNVTDSSFVFPSTMDNGGNPHMSKVPTSFLRALIHAFHGLQRDIGVLPEIIKEREDKIASLRNQIRIFETTRMRVTVRSYVEESGKGADAIKELKLETAGLEKDLEAGPAFETDIIAEINQLQDEVAAVQRKNAIHRNALCMRSPVIIQKNIDLHRKLRENSARIQGLKDKIKTLEKEICDQYKEIKKDRERIQALTIYLNKYTCTGGLKHFLSEIDKKQEEIRIMVVKRQDLKDSQQDLAVIKGNIDKLKAELQALPPVIIQKNIDLHRKLRENSARIQGLKDKIKTLQMDKEDGGKAIVKDMELLQKIRRYIGDNNCMDLQDLIPRIDRHKW